MDTDELLIDAVEYLDREVPDDQGLVPFSLALERDPDTGIRQWGCYIEIKSRRWGEIEVSARSKYPTVAIVNALARFRREIES